MSTRRAVLQAAMAGAAVAASPSWALGAEPAVVFDALGEMRTVYTTDLLDQILASGTRAIGVTVTDPKVEADKSLAQTNADLDAYDRYYDAHPSYFIRAKRAADVDRAAAERKIAVFYNLQNSTPVEADFAAIAALRARGVTSIQLTYNDLNRSGAGCFVDDDPGVTPFGRELIARLEAEKVLMDLSHAGMRTMADAVAAARRPAIVSHTRLCSTVSVRFAVALAGGGNRCRTNGGIADGVAAIRGYPTSGSSEFAVVMPGRAASNTARTSSYRQIIRNPDECR